MQRMDQEQEEVGHLSDRTRYVANGNDPGPVTVLALPRREEGHTAPGGVAAQCAADVEMAAALALARFRIALAQPPRDLADQRAHLRDLAPFDTRERRVAQDVVA